MVAAGFRFRIDGLDTASARGVAKGGSRDNEARYASRAIARECLILLL